MFARLSLDIAIFYLAIKLVLPIEYVAYEFKYSE